MNEGNDEEFNPGWSFTVLDTPTRLQGVGILPDLGFFLNQGGKKVTFNPHEGEDPFEALLLRHGFFTCQKDAGSVKERILANRADKLAMGLQIKNSGLPVNRPPEFTAAQIAFNQPTVDLTPSVQGVLAVGVYLRGRALCPSNRTIPYRLSRDDLRYMLERLKDEGQITEADENRLRNDLATNPRFAKLPEATPFELMTVECEAEATLSARGTAEMKELLATGQMELTYEEPV